MSCFVCYFQFWSNSPGVGLSGHEERSWRREESKSADTIDSCIVATYVRIYVRTYINKGLHLGSSDHRKIFEEYLYTDGFQSCPGSDKRDPTPRLECVFGYCHIKSRPPNKNQHTNTHTHTHTHTQTKPSSLLCSNEPPKNLPRNSSKSMD